MRRVCSVCLLLAIAGCRPQSAEPPGQIAESPLPGVPGKGRCLDETGIAAGSSCVLTVSELEPAYSVSPDQIEFSGQGEEPSERIAVNSVEALPSKVEGTIGLKLDVTVRLNVKPGPKTIALKPAGAPPKTLDFRLNVYTLKWASFDKQKEFYLVLPIDMSIAEKVLTGRTLPDPDPTILKDPVTYPNAFHMALSFKRGVAPGRRDKAVLTLTRRKSGKRLRAIELTETGPASMSFRGRGREPVTLTLHHSAKSDPSVAEISMGVLRARRDGVLCDGSEMLLETQPGSNTFVSQSVSASMKLAGHLDPKQVDTISVALGEEREAWLDLAETAPDSQVFEDKDHKMRWRIMWLGSIAEPDLTKKRWVLAPPTKEEMRLHDDVEDAVLVSLCDGPAMGRIRPLLLLESGPKSLDFSGSVPEDERMAIANPGSLYVDTYPSIEEFDRKVSGLHAYFLKIYDESAKAGDFVTLTGFDGEKKIRVPIVLEKGNTPHEFYSVRPVVLCKGEIPKIMRKRYGRKFQLIRIDR